MTTKIVEQPTAGLTDLISIDDLSGAQISELFSITDSVKPVISTPGNPYEHALAGKSIIMLFEKPSLRTRISFEVGLTKLGAHAMYYDHSKQRIGERESVRDYALNLERWVDGVIARTYSHQTLIDLAEHGSVPVVNALSDDEHPCQVLADLYTLHEAFGSVSGLKLAWVGDGNNVCHSLMIGCAKLGVSMTAVTPKGFVPGSRFVESARAAGQNTGATITLSDSLDAVEGHHAVYTDTWVSMGQDSEADSRGNAFAGYQVSAGVMALASKGLGERSKFMHCLPAHRGEEVTDEVIDSGESLVYEQAENRMHAQNSLFLKLFGKA